MSAWTSLKGVMSAVKQAAVDAGESMKKEIAATQMLPTDMRCMQCNATIPIPQDIYSWPCQTPACAATKLVNAREVKVCATCNECPRPKFEAKSIACQECQAENEVPATNAAKGLREAGRDLKKGAENASQYTKKKIQALGAPPESMPCLSCGATLAVPPQVFDWQCANQECQNLGLNPRTSKECDNCHTPKPKLPAPRVQCGGCDAVQEVPATGASAGMKSAAFKTKMFAKTTTQAAKESIAHMRAKPAQFHCQHCHALNDTPGAAKEADGEGEAAKSAEAQPAEEQAASAEEEQAQASNEEKKAETPKKIECTSCGKMTAVTKTNLGHSWDNAVLSVNKSFADLGEKMKAKRAAKDAEEGEQALEEAEPVPEAAQDDLLR